MVEFFENSISFKNFHFPATPLINGHCCSSTFNRFIHLFHQCTLNQEISDLGETLQPSIQTAIKDVNGLLKQPLAELERDH